MAGRGPAPVPTPVLKLRGSRIGHRKGEPQPGNSAPQCPEWMRDEAKREWDRITAELLKLDVVTQWDRAALATYCEAWADFVETAQSGSFTAKYDAMRHLKQLCQEFGLTPASRTRVRTEKKPETKDSKARFFGGA